MVPQPARRLLSIDVLRGFDMFWIIGMEEVAGSLAKAIPNPATRWFGQRLSHVPWEGLHALDLVFPLFVFICGTSLVFSLSRAAQTAGRAAALRKLALRSLILYCIGTFIYYEGLWHWDHIRWLGVLQRIAIANFVAGVLFLYVPSRGRVAILAAVLLAYAGLLCFVPIPGGHAGDFLEGPDHNWPNWIDAHYLPGWRWDGTHDPEGILSTFPAICTCLLGVVAGEHLRRQPEPSARSGHRLAALGLVLALLGWLWASPVLGPAQFPVIKKLWTSSYVLVAGGYSMVLLGLLSAALDLPRRDASPPLPLRPFLWIGGNAILLYLVNRFANLGLVERLVPLPGAADEHTLTHLALALLTLAATIALAWLLYRRQFFVRA